MGVVVKINKKIRGEVDTFNKTRSDLLPVTVQPTIKKKSSNEHNYLLYPLQNKPVTLSGLTLISQVETVHITPL